MKLSTLVALLNRAAAAIETPGDLTKEEKDYVAEDLALAAKEVARGDISLPWKNKDGSFCVQQPITDLPTSGTPVDADGDGEDLELDLPVGEKHYDGTHCPHCGSDQTITGKIEAEDARGLLRHAECHSCNATWLDEYKLAGFEDLKVPEPEEKPWAIYSPEEELWWANADPNDPDAHEGWGDLDCATRFNQAEHDHIEILPKGGMWVRVSDKFGP